MKKITWFRCPFCGCRGLVSKYTTFGTEIYCGGYGKGKEREGCNATFVFPAFENEVKSMWSRTRKADRDKLLEKAYLRGNQ